MHRTDRPDILPDISSELHRLETALARIRDLYPNMTVGTMATFLALAREQERNWDGRRPLKRVAEEMGINYPTLTRHVDVLGAGVASSGGLGLVEKRIDADSSLKERRVALTERGLSLLHEIQSVLNPDLEAQVDPPRPY